MYFDNRILDVKCKTQHVHVFTPIFYITINKYEVARGKFTISNEGVMSNRTKFTHTHTRTHTHTHTHTQTRTKVRGGEARGQHG